MTARWIAMQCDACGGAIAFDPSREDVRCLFCAAVALVPAPIEAPDPPEHVVGFSVDEVAAQLAFDRWVRGSWWRPKALAEVRAALRPLWLPTWRIDAEVELHWAALVDAPTRSGKRPRTGVDLRRAQVLVPASGGVDVDELAALRPFDSQTRPWTEGDRAIPCELPSLSEAGALAASVDRFATDGVAGLARELGLHGASASARLVDATASLAALPVWIGSFQFRGRPWRVVVNGTTGRIVGRAPIDRVKVAIVVVLALVAALLFARCSGQQPEPDAVLARSEATGATQSGSAQAASPASHGTTTSRYCPG